MEDFDFEVIGSEPVEDYAAEGVRPDGLTEEGARILSTLIDPTYVSDGMIASKVDPDKTIGANLRAIFGHKNKDREMGD